MEQSLYPDSELQMNTQMILCLEECDDHNKNFPVDTRLFIGWDEGKRNFFVRGKRQDTHSTNFVPFTFNCNSKNILYDYIKFTVDKNRINVILFNYNNTCAKNVDELTYEFFESQKDHDYEIGGYDRMKLNRERIVTNLRMLQKVYH